MDNDTTIQDLKDRIKNFIEDRDWAKYHNAKDVSIGIITESAELLEHFRFKSEHEIKQLFKTSKKQEIEDEMADVLSFLLELANLYDIDLSDAFIRKLKKNAVKYPVEKAKGKNKKYTEL